MVVQIVDNSTKLLAHKAAEAAADDKKRKEWTQKRLTKKHGKTASKSMEKTHLKLWKNCIKKHGKNA